MKATSTIKKSVNHTTVNHTKCNIIRLYIIRNLMNAMTDGERKYFTSLINHSLCFTKAEELFLISMRKKYNINMDKASSLFYKVYVYAG